MVGIAGRKEKCRYVAEELGFDACISRLSPSFAQDLKAACPDGIDIYFENVGGMVFEAVLPLLKPGARMTICGLIAHYGDAPGADARAQERRRAEAGGVRVRTCPSANMWRTGTTYSWPRWHPGSRLARSVTARISARDLRSSPPLSPRCCAGKTSARPWSASRRIRLSPRSGGDLGGACALASIWRPKRIWRLAAAH